MHLNKIKKKRGSIKGDIMLYQCKLKRWI